jgi:hypothetical protein
LLDYLFLFLEPRGLPRRLGAADAALEADTALAADDDFTLATEVFFDAAVLAFFAGLPLFLPGFFTEAVSSTTA